MASLTIESLAFSRGHEQMCRTGKQPTGCHLPYWCGYLYQPVGMHAKSLHLWLTVCNPMECGPPLSHSCLLEWVAIASSRESSWRRDQTHVSASGGRQVDSLPLVPLGKPLTCEQTLIQVLEGVQWQIYSGASRKPKFQVHWACNIILHPFFALVSAPFSMAIVPYVSFFLTLWLHLTSNATEKKKPP